MPKTKLDKHRNSKTVAEEKAIIYKVMFDRGIYTQDELAKKMGASPRTICTGFSKGFSLNMKLRIHQVLQFDEPVLRKLLGVTL